MPSSAPPNTHANTIEATAMALMIGLAGFEPPGTMVLEGGMPAALPLVPGFLILHWREGRSRLVYGWGTPPRLLPGVFWIVMALLFVGGIMNLLWIGAIALPRACRGNPFLGRIRRATGG